MDSGLSALREEFGDRLPADVAEFFATTGSLHEPDWWNGYFVGPAKWSAGIHRGGEPREVEGYGDVVVVASNGGGTLYAVLMSGEVLVLPPGGIENGVYTGRARKVADSFSEFLDRLGHAATSGEWDPFDPYKS